MNQHGRRDRVRVERLAEDFVEWCGRWERALDRRPGLSDQVQRSAQSSLANVGEGMDALTMGEKRRYFGYALASTGEAIRLLRGAQRTRGVPARALEEGLLILRDLKWDLIRLVRWTRR
jgi:four helix bundle protein